MAIDKDILEELRELLVHANGPDGQRHPIGSDGYGRLRVVTPLPTLHVVQFTVPGIAAADALDAADAVGTVFSFPVPETGIIRHARLFDPDDDTLALTLHLFTKNFTGAASDAAYTVTADAARYWVTNIQWTTISDEGGGKVSEVTGTSYYTARDLRLYGQCSTSGTPNIAAGAMPIIQLLIEPLQLVSEATLW